MGKIFLAFMFGALSMAYVSRYVTHAYNFFGAYVEGKYVYKFNNQIQCAVINGWNESPKCYCTEIKQDDRIEGKVFIPMISNMCE